MNDELKSQISESKKVLESNEEGRLPLYERAKIWRIFGDGLDLMDKDNAEYMLGHKRRTVLQKMCAEKVLPLFENKIPDSPTCRETLNLIDNYLQRGYPPIEVLGLTAKGNDMLLCAQNYPYEDDIRLVGWACLAALSVSIRDQNDWEDENADIMDDFDTDAEGWHADMCSSLAFVNGGIEKEKLKKFWYWYLDTAVPISYNSAKAI